MLEILWNKFEGKNVCSLESMTIFDLKVGGKMSMQDLSSACLCCKWWPVFTILMLSTGMFQRLEKLRKNAFASVIVSGVDNNNTITGIWIMRGQDLAFTVSTKQFLASYHFIVDGWRQSILCCCCICTTLTVRWNGSIYHVANGAVSKPELENTVLLIFPLTWTFALM